MGQTFSGDNGDRNKQLLQTGLSATAGGLNAASGAPPAPPVDFSGIGTAIKKARAPKTLTLNNPTTGVIPKSSNDPAVPSLNVPASGPISQSPMPDLYSGQNGMIPQLRKPINGMLPFYGQ